jgi:hypothetical protein
MYKTGCLGKNAKTLPIRSPAFTRVKFSARWGFRGPKIGSKELFMSGRRGSFAVYYDPNSVPRLSRFSRRKWLAVFTPSR